MALVCEPCDTLNLARVRYLVGIELGGELQTTPSADALVVHLSCNTTALTLSLTSPNTPANIEVSLPRARLNARTRERLVSLAIAELLATGWAELETSEPQESQEPQPTEVSAPPALTSKPTTVSVDTTAENTSINLDAYAGGRWFGAPTPPLALVGIAITWPMHGPLALHTDIAGNYGSRTLKEGSLRTTGVEASLGLPLRAQSTWGAASLGPLYRVVWQQFLTHSADPTRVAAHDRSALWGGLGLQGWFSAKLQETVSLTLGFEAAWILQRFVGKADRRTLVAFEGLFGQATLGVSLAP